MTESRKTEPESKEGDEAEDVLLALEEMSIDPKQRDYAQLSENPQFKKMIIKHGDNFPVPEDLLYSGVVVKVSHNLCSCMQHLQNECMIHRLTEKEKNRNAFWPLQTKQFTIWRPMI